MCVSLVIDSGSVRFRRVGVSRAVGTWLLLVVFFSCAQMRAQSIYTVAAPPADGSTTGIQVPNGTREHAYHRTVTVVDGINLKLLPKGTEITRLGFVVTVGAGSKVDGKLIVYISNIFSPLADLNMVWSDIIGSMTKVYEGPFAVPDSAGPVDLVLSTHFAYTGRSLYVAYDFQSAGPFAVKNAVFSSNVAAHSLTRTGLSSTQPPEVLTDFSDFRPVIRFGFPLPTLQWNKITSGTQMNLNGLDIADDVAAWVCSSSGNVYRTIDMGKTWLGAGIVPDSAFAILGLTSDIAVAVAGKESDPSTLYSTSDGGSSWTRVYDPDRPMRIEVTGKTSRDIWCLGRSIDDSVILLTSQDRGSTWTRSFAGVVLPPGAQITSSCTVGSVVWLGAADKVYRVEADLRGPWKCSSTGRPNVSCLVFGSSNGTGFAAHLGCRDTLYRSLDGGLTWAAVAVPGLGEIVSLQYFPGGQDAWAATSTGIWRTSDFGSTWQRSFSTDKSSVAFSSVRFFPDFQDALAIGSNGAIVKGSWISSLPVAVSETSSQPEGYRLGLNYPNPFNGRTWIEFTLPRPSFVTLTIFDVLGRAVVILVSGERGTGTHTAEWNSAGNPSGVYFYRLHARAISGGNAGDYVEACKLILLK